MLRQDERKLIYYRPNQPGVTSIMIARGAEANPSCFASDGLRDPIDTILPLYTRTAMVVANAFQNSKYCINAMDLACTSKPPSPGIKQIRHKLKSDMTHLKDYKSLCELLGLNYEELSAKEKRVQDVLPDLEGRLSSQNEEVHRETEGELKRKVPKLMEAEKQMEKKSEKEEQEKGDESSKENEPVASI